jgi:hypothetical protein
MIKKYNEFFDWFKKDNKVKIAKPDNAIEILMRDYLPEYHGDDYNEVVAKAIDDYIKNEEPHRENDFDFRDELERDLEFYYYQSPVTESTDIDEDSVRDIIESIGDMSEEINNYSNKLKTFKNKLGEHTDSKSVSENDQLDDAIIEINSAISKLDDVVDGLDNTNVSLKDYVEKGKQYLY